MKETVEDVRGALNRWVACTCFLLIFLSLLLFDYIEKRTEQVYRELEHKACEKGD